MRGRSPSLDEAERKRLFDEVQKIFAEHLPIVYFVAPRIYVAHVRARHQPDAGRCRPQLLWAPDTIAVHPLTPLPRAAARASRCFWCSPCRRRRSSSRGSRRATTSTAVARHPGEPRRRSSASAPASASTGRSPRSTATGCGGVRLDFGRSLHYDRPVRDLIPERAANTAILALTALSSRPPSACRSASSPAAGAAASCPARSAPCRWCCCRCRRC